MDLFKGGREINKKWIIRSVKHNIINFIIFALQTNGTPYTPHGRYGANGRLTEWPGSPDKSGQNRRWFESVRKLSLLFECFKNNMVG